MKISIITPIYNAVTTIEKTITSVLNQNLRSDLEYIVVDGGSQDGSLEIIRRYLDKINIFISEKDNGIYDAINKGIICSSGQVVGIINADDWYNEQALEIVENVFQNPEIDIVYSPIDNYNNGKYLNTFIPGSLEKLLFKFTLNHPSCFVRKSVYEQIGLFNINYSIAADYDFIFRAYTRGFRFDYVKTPLASYSLNGFSGKPRHKFKQISESWQVGSEFAKQTSQNLVRQRQFFYSIWVVKELLTLLPKQFLQPPLVQRMKYIWRKQIGKLIFDEYGQW